MLVQDALLEESTIESLKVSLKGILKVLPILIEEEKSLPAI